MDELLKRLKWQWICHILRKGNNSIAAGYSMQLPKVGEGCTPPCGDEAQQTVNAGRHG